MGWTLDDLKKLNLAEISPGVFKKAQGKTIVLLQKKVPKKKPKAYYEMMAMLESLDIPFVMEHRFDEYRKFRFDFAFVDKKVAVEYEGIMSKKSRHTTVGGYSKDADKYNLAQKQGWSVFRFTVLNYKNLLDTIRPVLTSE